MSTLPDSTNGPATVAASSSPAPNDIYEIVDALHRFAAGQDQRDRELFESAFSADAVVDFTGPAKRFGVDLPIFRGRTAIADTIMGTTAGLDTTHSVTNPRIQVTHARAHLSALVEAQHLPKGDHSRHLLLKNVYTLELSRAGTGWVIDHMKIDNVWYTGDPTVLLPAAR